MPLLVPPCAAIVPPFATVSPTFFAPIGAQEALMFVRSFVRSFIYFV